MDTAPHRRVAVVNATLPSLLGFAKGSELRLRVRTRNVYWVLTGRRWDERLSDTALSAITAHNRSSPPGQLELYPSGLLTPGANTLSDCIALAGTVVGRVSLSLDLGVELFARRISL